jgi:hypothetical protein
MKKLIALVLALVCVLALVGCGQNDDPTTPTGYPTGKIQQPQIMYNGQVYYYFATGFDEPLPDGYGLVGSITVIDNDNEPTEDFHGSRVELGQEVYASASNAETVYVKYKKGYAKFVVKSKTEPQNEVMQFFADKYDMKFTLWGPEGQDLYAFYIYPEYAERECHILMPENTDDVAEYHKDLSWEVVDDELIITGAWQEIFKIDITAETATSKTTGKVYQIYEMQSE